MKNNVDTTRRKLVVGNWKMHGDVHSNQILLQQLLHGLADCDQADYVVCVPNPYLHQAQCLLAQSNIAWGGQNVYPEETGAFTGAVAPHMLRDFGCRYVLLGHSERRSLFHETNLTASARFQSAINANLIPVFCVGETLAEHEAGLTELVIAGQMDAVIATLDEQAFKKATAMHMVFAYEPVWAIGTGKVASPEDAQKIHAFIRHRLAKRSAEGAANIRIIYGGSVTAQNAGNLFAMPDIDGVLVGRASLDAGQYIQIGRLANTPETSPSI